MHSRKKIQTPIVRRKFLQEISPNHTYQKSDILVDHMRYSNQNNTGIVKFRLSKYYINRERLKKTYIEGTE